MRSGSKGESESVSMRPKKKQRAALGSASGTSSSKLVPATQPKLKAAALQMVVDVGPQLRGLDRELALHKAKERARPADGATVPGAAVERRDPGTTGRAGRKKQKGKSLQEQVEERGASQLSKRDRKAWEAHKLLEQGFKEPQKIKTPLPILLKQRRHQARGEAARYERELAMGLNPKKKKRKRDAGNDRVVREHGKLSLSSVGKFSQGILHLKQKVSSGNVTRHKKKAEVR
eukprot:g46013.t1